MAPHGLTLGAPDAKLPSRGLILVAGTINGSRFQAALEPDYRGSHRFSVDKTQLEKFGASAVNTVTLEIAPGNSGYSTVTLFARLRG